MAIERRLTEIAGPVGGKLHTARSRNDQVATDLAMFTRERAARRARGDRGADGARCSTRAEAHLDWPMPGYTHLQRAQPVYLGHHLLAYFWMLARDRERFAFARARRPDAAARRGRAGRRELRHRPAAGRRASSASPSVAPNSIDAVSNRDFVLDYLARRGDLRDAPLAARRRDRAVVERGVRLLRAARRLGVGLLDHAAEEEPRRRRAAARQGAARRRAPAALHGVMHGLPLTYNKDLQEDKEHLFDAVDTLELCARGRDAGCSAAIALRPRARWRAAASDELIAATDVADLLVRRGVPFREAHGDRRRARARRASTRGTALSRARRARSSRARTPPRSTTSSTRCSRSARGWSRRSPRAAPRCARVREQLDARAGRAGGAAAERRSSPTFYARPVLEVARDLVGCVVAPRRDGRA